MAPQDLWYKKDEEGNKVRSARYGRGKRWRVNYEDPHTGDAKSPSFETKKEAEKFENNIKADISRGVYVDPAGGRQTVAEYAEKWRLNQLHRGNTADRTASEIRRHIVPLLGHLKMHQVRSKHIKNWVLNRTNVMKASSLRMVYRSTLAPMFDQAAVDHEIPSSPCVNIKMPVLDEKIYTIPTTEQVYDLAAALPPEWRVAPLVVAGCGHRTMELLATEKRDIDFLRRNVHIRQQLVDDTGRDVYLGPLKTRTSKRIVEMGASVGDLLAQHFEAREFPDWEMDDESDASLIEFGPDGERRVPRRPVELILPRLNGGPMTSFFWWEIWRPAADKVGLPKGFGLRDLRHYYATALIYGGANVKTVQLAMGHATPATTLNVYTGYWPDAEDSVRGLIDKALARPKGRAQLSLIG